MSNQKNFLYKYRAIDENNIERSSRIFTHNELYFASADQFNDPFDCSFDFSFEASAGEVKKYWHRVLRVENPILNKHQREKWIAEHHKELTTGDPIIVENLKQGSADILSKLGICSFSRVPDDILMWSHYANCHKGFCIQFFDDDKENFIGEAQKILYADEYPIVNPMKDDHLDRLIKTLLTKAKHWKYEKEWRMIDYKNGPGVRRFPPHLLVGVIFGCRITEKHQALIREWCGGRQAKISFYQARESAQKYSLELIDV